MVYKLKQSVFPTIFQKQYQNKTNLATYEEKANKDELNPQVCIFECHCILLVAFTDCPQNSKASDQPVWTMDEDPQLSQRMEFQNWKITVSLSWTFLPLKDKSFFFLMEELRPPQNLKVSHLHYQINVMQIIYFNLSEIATRNVFFHKTKKCYKMDCNFCFLLLGFGKSDKSPGNFQIRNQTLPV